MPNSEDKKEEKKFADRIKMMKAPLLKGAFDIVDEKHQVLCTIAKFGNEVNIQFIQSFDEGMGNCQQFIKEFKKDVEERGMKLVSSTPISKAWEHICKKFKLKVYE